jgi:tetratricopeptide (TPR) repeat protein
MSTPLPNPRASWQASAAITSSVVLLSPIDRLAGLSPRVQRLVIRAQQWLDRGEVAFADRSLAEAAASAPDHPEIQRLRAVTLHLARRYDEAIVLLRRSLATRPEDPATWNNLGSALGETGDLEAALDAFRRSSEAAPELAVSWFNLGKASDALLKSAESEVAYSRALMIDPEHLPARVLRANVLKTLGRLDEAAAEFRKAIAQVPDSAEAWAGLVGMKAVPIGDDELAALERLHRRPDLRDHDRALIGFAYALALEARGRLAEAYEATAAANAARRKHVNWNADDARKVFESIGAAFAKPHASAEGDLGREVVFLVSLPRSGSTLAEQILAAHRDVQGAGELAILPEILREESRRRGVDFPAWIGEATAEDWTRLGRTYLDRTAHWRREHRVSTDQNLQNWQVVGAIRAMLPGARLIECRRDPIETLWSAWKHQFANDLPFTYDLDELAAYSRDYDRLMRTWHARYPGAIARHDYEALIAEPEARIRALLDAAGLDFDPSCLDFHEAERDVRTASAAQVRAPLARDTARADRYGSLFDPLREALARAAG